MAHNKDNLHDLRSREKQVQNLIFGDSHEDSDTALSYSPQTQKTGSLKE